MDISNWNEEKWVNLLDHSFVFNDKNLGQTQESKIAYLSQNIFEFTTYDSSIDELFGKKAIEVCNAITNKTTFSYIEDQENYIWYLLMCNIPFFSERIDWGGSIRGAWWSADIGGRINFQSCGLWDGEKQLSDDINFSVAEWETFIRAIILFSSSEMPA